MSPLTHLPDEAPARSTADARAEGLPRAEQTPTCIITGLRKCPGGVRFESPELKYFHPGFG